MEYLADRREMQEIDRRTIDERGIPGILLMECAAHCTYEEIARHCAGTGLTMDSGTRALVVVEGGNNGGDGLALARRLSQQKVSVTVWYIGGISRVSESFEYQMDIIKKLGISCVNLSETRAFEQPSVWDYDIIVDGIFGVGLSREIQGIWRDVIDTVNKMEGFKVAIDVPSGVDATTGCILGTAFDADMTVTFGLNKRGLVLYPGCMRAGRVIVCDIGFGEDEIQSVKPEAYTMGRMDYRRELKRLLPERVDYSNKGTYGRVAVIAGSRSMSGAMTFAAEAAYRTGAGLVKIYTHENNRVAAGVNVPEAVLMTYGSADETCEDEAVMCAEDAMRWADVILVGSGLGKEPSSYKLVETLLERTDKPLVIDADGLNIISENMELLRKHRGDVVITPHIGEMSRLLRGMDAEKQGGASAAEAYKADDIKKNILEVCKGTAKEYNIINVLKDARTCVSDGKDVYINTTGNNGMSTAGAGDVLAGLIAGFAGTGLPLHEAAVLGVYVHGLAGDMAAENTGKYGMTARDIVRAIPMVLKGAEDEQL